MGFFSWKTADDNRSIYNTHSDRGATEVYLIQPDGRPGIHEPDYEGYGVFGGVDAYVWLARENLPAERLVPFPDDAGISDITVRGIGIALAFGYKVHVPTGTKFVTRNRCAPIIDPEIVDLQSMWGEPVAMFGGRTLKEVTDAGEVEQRSFPIPFPLKFSCDEHAVYENLPASEDCPQQGHFCRDEDEDDHEEEPEEEIEEDDDDLDHAT